MRAAAVVALLLHALPGAANATNVTFVRGPEGLNYPEAAAFCTEIGATIASIHSAAENELARTACGGSTCWLGLEEIGGNAWTPKASQTWRWVDGSDSHLHELDWFGTEQSRRKRREERHHELLRGVEGVALTDTGGWYDVTEVYDQPKPLCRLVGELSFDLVHVPKQCQELLARRGEAKRGRGLLHVRREDVVCGRQPRRELSARPDREGLLRPRRPPGVQLLAFRAKRRRNQISTASA